jgi:uncharacterized protein (DUF3820 family)
MKQKLKKKVEARKWNQSLASNEYTQRRLTFGMWAGKMIKEVPIEYIKWGILNFKDGAWAEMFARELQRRQPKYR